VTLENRSHSTSLDFESKAPQGALFLAAFEAKFLMDF
jgi:hypothetical protein